MKTIVMYIDFVYGHQHPTGGTKRYLELIYGLVNKGNTVHLFVPKDADLRTDQHLIRHDIRVCSVKRLPIPNGLLTFLANLQTLLSIRRINYDAIISFDVPSSIQFKLLGLKKLLLFIRQDLIGYRRISSDSCHFITTTYLAVLERIERTALLHAHRVVVQCEYDKEVLLKRHKRQSPLVRAKMFVLHNNVNPSWVKNDTRSCHRRTPAKNTTLAFVGGLNDSRKGLGLLLSAVSTLLDEGEDLSLHVVGGGQLLAYYRNQYKHRPHITFWGTRENPLEVTNECDLLVVPSLADSYPNTILEAFYLEMPVIGSDVGGIPEMLKYRDLVFTPTVEDLAAKLRDIIHSGALEVYREYSRKRKNDLTFDWVERVCDLI